MNAPRGTVTFVFTDVEGSTALLERLGDGYADLAQQHRAILREEFAARGGAEMDTQGDAEEGYVGIDVVRAARICVAGHGGQVLLSAATHALVAGSLPDGVAERDLGEHRLKDIERPERIYQLDVAGLQSSFPPLRTQGEERLDFERRLEQRIRSHVERRIEQALAEPEALPAAFGADMTRLALGGLALAAAGLVVLAALVVGVILVVRYAF